VPVGRRRVMPTKRNKKEATRNAGGVYEQRFRRKTIPLASFYQPVYPHVTNKEQFQSYTS